MSNELKNEIVNKLQELKTWIENFTKTISQFSKEELKKVENDLEEPEQPDDAVALPESPAPATSPVSVDAAVVEPIIEEEKPETVEA